MNAEPSHTNGELPRPRARQWRTRFFWPRDLRRFAPRVDAKEVLAELPSPAEAAHWGEVILLEDHVAALHADGTTSNIVHVVIMPHGDQNLAEWDEMTRVYDSRKARPRVRRAVVYLPDGTQRRAQQVNTRVDYYNHALKLRFAPLRPGVVVEYEEQYDEYQPDDVGPALWAQFSLQSFAPCRRRRITVAIAAPFTANVRLHHGAAAPEESREHGYNVYRWNLAQTAGIEHDQGTPHPADFAPWVDLSTLPGWQPVIRHYAKELLPPARLGNDLRELAKELAQGATTEEEKVRAVHRYAALDLRYGRHPSELEEPKVRDSAKMLEDLRGDCKDKSALMVALLGELGVEAHVVALLTAMNGRTAMLPSRRFDHALVLARVDGRDVWLDPAAGPFVYGEIPLNDQGVMGLVVERQGGRTVEIPLDTPERQTVERMCEGELDSSGAYTFRAQVAARGERAAMARVMLIDRNEDHRRRTVQQAVAEERPGAVVDEIEIENTDDVSRPLAYRYRVTLRPWARPVADLLLFRIPWAEPLLYVGWVAAAERLNPLQAPAVFRLVEEHEIALPQGYVDYALPWQSRRECEWASYHSGVECRQGKLKCWRTIAFRGGIVPTARFAEIKSFWEACVRDDQTDVVLRRTASAP